MAGRDRLRANVPGDRSTDRRAGDVGTRRRTEAPASASTRPRQARGKRSDDSANWPTTEWEKLSDVDYWAELAADKPLITTAQPAAPARDGQGGHDRDVHAGPPPVRAVPVPAVPVPAVPVPAVPVPAVPVPAVPVPAPVSAAPVYAAPVPAAPVPAAPVPAAPVPAAPVPAAPVYAAAPVPPPQGPRAAAGYGPDEPTIDQGGAAGQVQRRVQGSLDDDPLTSPSFPRVHADDSRSFRNSRGGGHTSGSWSAPTQQFASYDSPMAQLAGPVAAAGERSSPPFYPDAVPGPGYHGDTRAAGQASTDSYQAGSGSPLGFRSGAIPASYGAPSAAGTAPLPSGNPYGSYVGTPPSGGFPARSAQDLTGYRTPSHTPASDLTGHRGPSHTRRGQRPDRPPHALAHPGQRPDRPPRRLASAAFGRPAGRG